MARIWVDDDEPRDTHAYPSCSIWQTDGPCSCAHRRYKPLTTAEPRCLTDGSNPGQTAGYQRHRKRGETPCDVCFAAHRSYSAARRRSRGIPELPPPISETTDPNEEWRPIPGYLGYEASDAGRVRSLPRVTARRDGKPYTVSGRVMRLRQRKDGYLEVNMYGTTVIKVHILVLAAFVGPRPDGFHGCHNDGDKTNNRATNLRWDTPSANSQDAVKHRQHPFSARTHCPRGHLLEQPNLTAASVRNGHRACLACARAHAYRQACERKGLACDFQGISDEYHRRILDLIYPFPVPIDLNKEAS